MIRTGVEASVVRGEFTARGRRMLVAVEIQRQTQRRRVQVNRQPLRRSSDLRRELATVVFQPDDLQIVKGPPATRRAACDEAVALLYPEAEELQVRLGNCLRQRNALLRGLTVSQRRGPLDVSISQTLDVWDERLAMAGTAWAEYRIRALEVVSPLMSQIYSRLNPGSSTFVELSYQPDWLGAGLRASLAAARREDVERSVTTVGPHRDEIFWSLLGMPARTHASQGQQKALALAFRLALHDALSATRGQPPLLMLDDVFSELDPERRKILPRLFPSSQVVLTATESYPAATRESEVVDVTALLLGQAGWAAAIS